MKDLLQLLSSHPQLNVSFSGSVFFVSDCKDTYPITFYLSSLKPAKIKANLYCNQYAEMKRSSSNCKAVAACLLTKYLIQTFNFNLPLFSVGIITLSKYHVGRNGKNLSHYYVNNKT